MREEEILTYHGNGRVSRQVVQVEQPTEDSNLELTEEDAQEDPLFVAIVRQVMRRVQQSQQEG